MNEQLLWAGVQQAISRSCLAGCSIEGQTCFLFFNENPLGQPVALSFHPVAEVSLWLWQAEVSGARLWGELTNGEDSGLSILGCRLNQPQLWRGALQKSRQVEVVQGPHPATDQPRQGPQILLHLQPAIVAVHAAQLSLCTRQGSLSLRQLADLLQPAGLFEPGAFSLGAADPMAGPNVPAEAVLALDKGQKLVEQQRFQEALDTCQAVTKVWHGAADLHLTLGRCYLGLGEWRLAIGEFAEVLRLKPDHAEAYFGLGEAYDGTGRPSQTFYAQAALQLAAEGKLERAAEATRRSRPE